MFVPVINLSICYLFLLLIQTITSATPCVYDVGNQRQLDIRTLGIANGKGPKYDNIPITTPIPTTLSWNGCYDYSKSDGGSCTDAAACYTNTNTHQSTLIAKQSEMEFEHHDDNVNLLVYHHNEVLLTVVLTCRDADDEIVRGRGDSPTIYFLEIQSRCCCPGKCPADSSTSGGGIFLIILFSVIFVYIVGGMAFLKFSRGATGPDMIPNRILWLSILSYAIDGIRYCIQVIRHRSFSVDYQSP